MIAWARLSPRRIQFDISTVGNVGAGVDTLHTYTLPANSLATNGDRLRIRYGGVFANTANTKRVQASIDGQVIVNSGLFTIQARSWLLDIMIIRLTATTVRASTIYMLGNITRDLAGTVTGNGDFTAGMGDLTVSNLTSNAVVLLVQGESGAGANNDVDQRLTDIELIQQ